MLADANGEVPQKINDQVYIGTVPADGVSGQPFVVSGKAAYDNGCANSGGVA